MYFVCCERTSPGNDEPFGRVFWCVAIELSKDGEFEDEHGEEHGEEEDDESEDWADAESGDVD